MVSNNTLTNLNNTVCELFAGVGGFRLGLEKDGFWKIIWANQWEPSTKVQHAYKCYSHHYPEELDNKWSNRDISEVTSALEKNPQIIPDHVLLVGGFPCQDYSVATTKAKGIVGKKGVLWWEIEKILRAKTPPYVLLENVDRLLASPSKQRGRDMGIVLGCFRDLGYSVEWRVINAADYGFPQKRRRIFIFAFRDDTPVAKRLAEYGLAHEWLTEDGFFAPVFPVHNETLSNTHPEDFRYSIQDISDRFRFKFFNSGIMSRGGLLTAPIAPLESLPATLRSILQNDVDNKYFVDDDSIDRSKGWKYVKGSKSEKRITKAGFDYHYTEGAIPFPDNLDSPARTLLTGEGNKNPNRCSHLIKDPKTKRYRILTPIEAERLDGFPDGWTDTGMPESKRYFCMGNALVVGVVERISKRLQEIAQNPQTNLTSSNNQRTRKNIYYGNPQQSLFP